MAKRLDLRTGIIGPTGTNQALDAIRFDERKGPRRIDATKNVRCQELPAAVHFVYVGPDQMAVITAKTGDALPPGQILAKKGQQGIQEDVLGEGRHFLNPWM